MDSKIKATVDRLVSRYDLTSEERVAMANLVRQLATENQTLKDRVNVLSWQVNSDRQGGI